MSILNKPRRGQELGFVSASTSLVFGSELFLHFLDDIENSIDTLEGNVGNTVVITQLSDFPAAVAGVITLEVNHIYIIAGNIDIGANTIDFAFNSVIEGFGALISSITTSSSNPLLTGIVHAKILTLNAPHAVDVNGDALILQGVSLLSVSTVSVTIQDSPEVLINGLISVSNVSTVISISGSANGFIQITGGNIQDFNTTAIDLTTSLINLLFIDGVRISGSLGVAIRGLASSANIGTGAIVTGCAFVGGLTPLSGITKEDLKWRFTGNIGIDDSTTVGAMELVGNGTNTTLITNTPVQLAGNFVLAPGNERFILTSFELEALVDGSGLASISMDGGASAGGGSESYDIVLLQNGTPDTVFRAVSVDTSAGSIGLEVPVTWVAGDTFSIAITRRSGTRNWITANATLFIR